MGGNTIPGQRRVGVEIEFAGLTIERAVEVVEAGIVGRSDQLSDYEFEIHGRDYAAPFRVEVDFELLKRLGRPGDDSNEMLKKAATSVLETAANLWVPLELVSPPLRFGQLDALDLLVADLERAGAVGTQDSFAYAFGVQFNPTLPDLNAATILAHLRAFICLTDWLIKRDRTDMTRRLTSFADRFPLDYERLVLACEYAPDRAELIADYLQDNATRNRALDLLPLFSHIDSDAVNNRIDDPRIKSRPTFHYRLPNSRLGDTGWSLLTPWRDWLVVERLARAPAALRDLCLARANYTATTALLRDVDEWTTLCDRTIATL